METSEALHWTRQQQQQKIDMEPEQQLYTPKIENIAVIEIKEDEEKMWASQEKKIREEGAGDKQPSWCRREGRNRDSGRPEGGLCAERTWQSRGEVSLVKSRSAARRRGHRVTSGRVDDPTRRCQESLTSEQPAKRCSPGCMCTVWSGMLHKSDIHGAKDTSDGEVQGKSHCCVPSVNHSTGVSIVAIVFFFFFISTQSYQGIKLVELVDGVCWGCVSSSFLSPLNHTRVSSL
ncbi:hypothetical protein LAZ67_1003405 [Cordylochernes scorpioides]|uniref:Uncharacterized protein n=1 Tax=Cordylochernes scorpioides TaxID=51811 RepID=A0ABY6JYH1_9ARAC|nr:hypothetical protein LAZ67_1003405 [Cordylochernes scorpioides]